ncbi:MAG: PSD1 and planctomycete cytochrome C domain-containing protein [Pirellulaceae bacterium]|nr:PSD1 and planctomycete cytochrome C domain-containing protein [Pirellulaceae bacterium]
MKKQNWLWTTGWILGLTWITPGDRSGLVAQDAGSALQNDSAADLATRELFFEKDVRPILKVHCFLCHGEEPEKSGSLDLRLVRLISNGGDSGAAMVPGQADESLLVQRILADEMPPGPKKLTDAEKQTIAQWVGQGGRTARPEPEDPHAARFTIEELEHWSFQPVQRVELSPADPGDEQTNAIDRLVAEQLHEHGLSFAAPAEPHVLLRRLSFNLTGLPPTVAELEDFLSDESGQAFANAVERMLASPQYGERWARHWLDVAGYAESEGQVLNDRPRPHAWRYRDYVVDALNRDLPYSQFIQEQLAGDQMIDGSRDANNDEQARLLAATGFLQMAPDLSQTEDTLLVRNQAVADTIQTVTSAVLGLTVACAQCHDHRYDPITIDDYYRLRAVFDPAMSIQHWQPPSQRMVDMTNDATKAERARIEAEAVALQDDINARRRAHCQTIQDREIQAAPEDVRDALRVAVTSAVGDHSAEQKTLLEKYPKVRSIDWIVGQLVEYDGPSHRAFQEEEKKVVEIRDSKPLDRQLMAVVDRAEPVTSHVMFRGNPASPMHEVQPGELEVLLQHRADRATVTAGGGKRRLEYARQLTDGTHPTVARVIVNRVWQHHFGQGLVRTPGEFGLNGQRPTHPKLLDYLAHEFMANGWSLKWLHRQMVHSQVYQQASAVSSEVPVHANDSHPGHTVVRDSWTADPENRWLGRMSLRRLDAESVRDAVLVASGQMHLETGGPSVPLAEDDEGKAVIGTRILRDGLFAGIKDVGQSANRRSLYLGTQRALQLSMLQTFDLPEMKPNCQQRSSSTVAPQALLLMNDAWIVDATNHMTDRIWLQAETTEARIELAFRSAFACSATVDEIATCGQFLEQQAELFRQDQDVAWQKLLQEQPDRDRRRALASLCQMLLASNRFLYLE